jgi:hypothetical protein
MPGYDVFMKVETVDGEPKADDRFIDWANEVALGGPDTAPDDSGWANEVALGGPDTAPDDGGWANEVAFGGDRATTASTLSSPGEDVMCSNNLLIGAEGDNFLVSSIGFAADQASTNPSNDLPPMETLRSVDPWDPSAGLLPMESLTPVDTAGALVGDDSCPILSDAIVPSDFFLI